jgi:flagellar motor switch protein FliN/FliY
MTEDKNLDVSANAADASGTPGDMPLPDDLLGAAAPPAESAEADKVVNESDASEEDAEAAMLSMLENLPQEERSASAEDINFGSQAVAKAAFQQLSQPAGGGEPRNIDLLMDVSLPISIELGRTRMSISEILALGPGSVVELNKLAGEPVDLLVNQKVVAKGEVVVVDENFGLRITQLVTPEERLKSLGNE